MPVSPDFGLGLSTSLDTLLLSGMGELGAEEGLGWFPSSPCPLLGLGEEGIQVASCRKLLKNEVKVNGQLGFQLLYEASP